METLKSRAGVHILHIPYRGAALALNDLLAEIVQASFLVESLALPHIKSGRLTPLAVSSGKRSTLLPNVPTVAEQGFPGFDLVSWVGLAAPAGIPKDVLEVLRT
jgi:tripartite-type tricarboxylate transporter receptor subunit TctC